MSCKRIASRSYARLLFYYVALKRPDLFLFSVEIIRPLRGKKKIGGISQECSGNDRMSRDLEKKCQKISENARNFKFLEF